MPTMRRSSHAVNKVGVEYRGNPCKNDVMRREP